MLLYNDIKNKDIANIISNSLQNPIIKEICIQDKNKSIEEIQRTQEEFSRLIGYCILFKDQENIENYMRIKNKEEQIKFLEDEVAQRLGIPENKIKNQRIDIVKYVCQNFKENGYVFHGANSLSINKKMLYGLRGDIVNTEHQDELIKIEKIYRKYAPDERYSPLGFVAMDIKDCKTGWFFDGSPIHATIYANSPEWFSYFCGKSYVYFDAIPAEKRTGYAHKDYTSSLNAVAWLVKNYKMSKEDAKEIFSFFMKFWLRFKDTTPCLMLIPVKEIGINQNIDIEQYLGDEGIKQLFSDVILGKVYDGENCCSKKTVYPNKIQWLDLSSILPIFELNENKNEKVQIEYER